MKFAFCVEHDTDAKILCDLLRRVFGSPVEADQTYSVRLGGADSAFRLAHRIAATARAKGLDGAVFAIDNDDHVEHSSEHDAQPDRDCRFCRLRKEANVSALQGPTTGNPPLQFYFAVPVRTIETWLLLLRGHVFSGRPEDSGRGPFGRRELKRLVYGTDDADQRLRSSISSCLIAEGDLEELGRRSAIFKALVNQVREFQAVR